MKLNIIGKIAVNLLLLIETLFNTKKRITLLEAINRNIQSCKVCYRFDWYFTFYKISFIYIFLYYINQGIIDVKNQIV